MLYQALSHFDKEYLETNLYQWKSSLPDLSVLLSSYGGEQQ